MMSLRISAVRASFLALPRSSGREVKGFEDGVAEDGIAAGGDQGGHVEGGADLAASAGDVALAAELAAVAVEGSHPGQRGGPGVGEGFPARA